MANVKFAYCLSGQVHPIAKGYIVDNSDVITMGDFVSLNTDGHAVLATATNPILGSVVGMVGPNGEPIAFDAGSADTWTAASDNETVAQNKVLVNIDPTACYEVDFSAAIGTTSGSKVGARFDLTDHDTVNEASAGTGSAQVALVATTDVTTRGIVCIVENQLMGV